METQIKSLEEAKILTQNLPLKEDNKDSSTWELTSIFHEKLAPYFLYGGYIRVLDRYRIYIQRVEFYFHCENNGIKDDIVYHRNNYHVEGKLPYFSPFTLHAHASGFDIAFENPEKEYRASALIRAYEIYDENEIEKKYLNYDKDNKKFVHSSEPAINTQSTYLYDILNGFGDAGIISWIHNPLQLYAEPAKQNIKQDRRKGVYSIDRWPDYNEPRERKWSFERNESIKHII